MEKSEPELRREEDKGIMNWIKGQLGTYYHYPSPFSLPHETSMRPLDKNTGKSDIEHSNAGSTIVN